jgi:hypothetical protein
MTNTKFEARVKALGLRPPPGDMPMLEALVKDLDRAAATLRGPRPFGQEPLNAFRLNLGHGLDSLNGLRGERDT